MLNASSWRLRQYYQGVADGSKRAVKTYIVGHDLDPEEFLKSACECEHPIDVLRNVDDYTKRALIQTLVLGAAALMKRRGDKIAALKVRANSNR